MTSAARDASQNAFKAGSFAAEDPADGGEFALCGGVGEAELEAHRGVEGPGGGAEEVAGEVPALAGEGEKALDSALGIWDRGRGGLDSWCG